MVTTIHADYRARPFDTLAVDSTYGPVLIRCPSRGAASVVAYRVAGSHPVTRTDGRDVLPWWGRDSQGTPAPR